MITKEDVIQSMEHEIHTIRFLAGKIPPGRVHWRPTSGQRSVLELLQYLSHCAYSAMLYIVEENVEAAKLAEKQSEQVTPLNFDRAMAKQARNLRTLISDIPAQDFANKDTKLFWGTPVRLGRATMDIGLKFLACYRMQLFLYLKQMGVSHIGTVENWAGVDRPEPSEG